MRALVWAVGGAARGANEAATTDKAVDVATARDEAQGVVTHLATSPSRWGAIVVDTGGPNR